MIRQRLILAFVPLLVLMLACAVNGEPAFADTNRSSESRLELDLSDGSRVVGSPVAGTIRFKTAYGAMDVTLGLIESIDLAGEGGPVALRFRNGDELRGELGADAVVLDMLFGRYAVPTKHILTIAVIEGESGPLQAIHRKSLVAWYDFEKMGKTVADLGNAGNDATVHGAKQVGADGRKGKVCKFSSQAEHIRVPGIAALDGTTALTVAVWVTLTDLGPSGYANERGYIVSKGKALWWDPAFSLGYSKGGKHPARFYVGSPGGGQRNGGAAVVSGAGLEAGKWYHLAGTYDGKEVKLFVNGKLQGSQAYAKPLRSDRAPVHVGGGNLSGIEWGGHFTVHGSVDDMMIWTRALTSREIVRLYRSQDGR